MRLLLLAALLALARASVLDQENQNGPATSSNPTQSDVLPSDTTVSTLNATLPATINRELKNQSISGKVKTNDTGSSPEQMGILRENTSFNNSLLNPKNSTKDGLSLTISGEHADDNALSQRDGICRSTWISISTGCYFIITQQVDWFQARDNCKNRGGYLAEIGSAEEQSMLASKIKELNFKRWGYWIGLSYITKEWSWVWDFSGKQAHFTSWKSGEPSRTDILGREQDCVAMFQGGNIGGDGSWDDDECSRKLSPNNAHFMGAICELKEITFPSEPSLTAPTIPTTATTGPTISTTDTEPLEPTTVKSSTPIVATISVLGVLLLCLCFALAIICACRRKGKTVESSTLETAGTSDNTHSNLPKHIVLQKDDSLKDNAKSLAENKELLNDEFKRAEDHAKMYVKKKTTIGNLDENKAHNRYTDIVPYDDNCISLTSAQFSPPETSYVNASRIMFEGCPITFIAAQAPRPASFRHFWHMVIQEGVSVIMMITRLVEGRKRKADQYWPDQEQAVVEVGEGSRVELASSSYQGTYHLRRFTLWLPDGGMRQVCQLQTEDWPDLGAPEGPRLLVDLLLRAQDLHREAGPGPMLVHCSAGVGRTGTFMALYKLWLDYQATSCTSLAIMPTVLALREQRCLMVQKEVQYHYIARCLSFMVSCEEGDYYMATGGEADYWAP